MLTDNHLNPPEPCSACEMYYAYRDGLCWECWHSAQEERAFDKYQEKRERNEE